MKKNLKKIAVFANGMSNDYITQILEGIRAEAAKDEADIFVFVSYIYFFEAEKQNKCQLNMFHLPNPKDFSGAIMLSNTFNIPDEQERIVALFGRAGVPIVTVETKVNDFPYIGSENYQGMFELANHIIDVHNAKRIVYFAGIPGNQEDAIRKQAVVDALQNHGMKLYDCLQGDFGYYKAINKTLEWLEENEVPDAIICANDYTALGVSAALFNKGYSVPNDCIITGFDHVCECRSSFPMIASVSRGWDKMGNKAYGLLKDLVENGKCTNETIENSFFVPSESCGCEASETDSAFRIKWCRDAYSNVVYKSMLSYFFKDMRNSLLCMEEKEQFFECTKVLFEENKYLGNDFCICTESSFFDLSDVSYPERIRGYSKEMDVIYSKEHGKSVPLYSFDTSSLYPKYRKEKGKSNTYVFTPLNHMEYIIGYIAVKNDMTMLYNQSLLTCVTNLDAIFLQVRRYIFAQKTNAKLNELYMNDSLTGVYNRNGCNNVLYKFIEEQKEEVRNSLLLFVDVNRMKYINDEYGHLRGDIALKATAEAMRKYLPKDWLIGRFGGDEFVCVGDFVNVEGVEAFKENMLKAMDKYFAELKFEFPLSVSIGTTLILPGEEMSVEDYIQTADDDMYEDKEIAHKIIDEMIKAKK